MVVVVVEVVVVVVVVEVVPPEEITIIFPLMKGCISQWKLYVPSWLNVREKLLPTAMTPASHTPVSLVEVCCEGPKFVQVTVLLMPNTTVLF